MRQAAGLCRRRPAIGPAPEVAGRRDGAGPDRREADERDHSGERQRPQKMSDCYGDPRWGEADSFSESPTDRGPQSYPGRAHGREDDEEEYAAQARQSPGRRAQQTGRSASPVRLCCEPDQRAFLESPGEAAIVEKRKIPFEAIAARRNESKLRVRVQQSQAAGTVPAHT